jgi:hypothetical protein
MSAVKDEILRLADELPDDDLVEVVAELRGRAELRAQGAVLKAEGHVTGSLIIDDSRPAQQRQQQSKLGLRWPHLGPAAVGGAVLLGWFVGLVGGPLVAVVGAALGLVLGDQLDQRTTAASET